MPGHRKGPLLERVLEAIRICGWTCIVLESGHPFLLALNDRESRLLVRLYIWNLTHGGYPRNPNELRIQITGVPHFVISPGEKTVILGWNEDEQMFAGFDISKHSARVRKSPSFQIRRETLQRAKKEGFAAQLRGNDEITLAFRPDFFVTYLQEMDQMHGAVHDKTEVDTLEAIAINPSDNVIRDIPAGPRRIVFQRIQRRVRDSRFRANVLSAYDHRCAVSGIQLDLLDAAHIVPVEHQQGTDETRNGICLSSLHHRAFDQGLLGIKRDYSIVINRKRVAELKALMKDGGLSVFRDTLRDHILLPPRKELYPNPDYLLLGQVLRGWRSDEL